MADRILSSGVTVAQALGVRPPQRQTLTTGLADLEFQNQEALNRIAGLGAASAPRLRPPPSSAMQAGPDIYYSPSTDRYAAGGMEFGSTEYDVALRAMENLQAPTAAPGGDFRRIDPGTFQTYIQSIGEGRGFLGNVGMGFRDVGEGVVGGVGRGLQMLGAEDVGQTLVDVGEFLGPTAADEARDAAIRAQQGLGQQILTAGARSIPTVALSIAGGLGGGALAAGGLRAAAAGGVAARAGQAGGVFSTILPMELQSSWQAAEQRAAEGGPAIDDPATQQDIWRSAFYASLVQTVPEALLTAGFSRAFQSAVDEAARRTFRQNVGLVVGAGAMEGGAEASAELIRIATFDPELRAAWNEADWAAFTSIAGEDYANQLAVAAGAGALLGGGFRAGALALEGRSGREPTRPPVDPDSGQPTDMLSGATLEPQAAPGTQGELFTQAAAPVAQAYQPARQVPTMGGQTITVPATRPTPPDLTTPPAAELAERNALLQERGRLERRAAEFNEQARTGSLDPAVLNPIMAELQRVRTAIGQIDARLVDLSQGGMPPAGLPFAQRMGQQPTLPFGAAPAPAAPAPAAPAPAAPAPAAPAPAPPLLLTPEQQVNTQEIRAAERQAAVAEQNRQLDVAQTAQIAQARRERDFLRQRNIALAARRRAAADADVEAQAAQASAARRLASAARQETAAAQGAAADARIEEALATQGTPAARILYGNLIRAERRVAAADEALRAARTSGDPVRIQQAGAELVDAQAALARLRARNEEDVLPEPPVRAEPPTIIEPAAAPEGAQMYGTSKGNKPFRSPPNELSRQAAAKRAGVPASELEVVEVDGGYMLRVRTPEDTAPTIKPQEVLQRDPRAVDLPIAAITRPNGAIGTQGVTTDQVNGILVNVLGMDIAENASMRQMIDALKADPAALQRLRDFTAANPIQVNLLPDNTYHVKDGHHRAFMLKHAGDETVPAIVDDGGPTGGGRTTPQQGAATRRARRQRDAAKLKRGARRAVRKQGPKESTLRKGPEAGPRVRGEDTKGQEAAGEGEAQVQAEEVVATEYPPLAGPRSEAFGTFNRIRYKRRGDQFIEERRVDEVDGGRIQKPGTWKYSSTLLTKEQADARYAKRQEEGFDRDTAVDLEALPEGPPPRRRQTPEPTPEPEPEAPPKRGDSAPTDMGVTEAWDKYVKPFLIAPVERTAISKGAFASQWSDAVKAGRGNVTTAISILRQTTSYPPLEAQAILSLDPAVTPVDEDTREAALWTLMETAFTAAEGGTPVKALGNKKPIPFAQDVLSEHAWTKADKEALLDFATEETIAAARAQPNPTEQMRALNRLLAGTGVLNTTNDVDADTTSNPASDLVDEIVGYNEAPHIAEGWEQNRLRELVRAFNKYASQNPEAYGSVVEGNTPIYQYINNQGYVNFQGGRIVPNPKATDPRTQERVAAAPEQVERGEAGLAGMIPRGTRTKGEGRFSQIDLNDISNAIDTDGKPIRGAMPLGKQKMVAKSFLKRLRNAPRMYMFKDQADLLKRNPALHARAAGARTQGDFDQAPAAGYSFGNGEVIIFTDRIANAQHLKFVLAHETFGHYGLRGVLPNAEFDKVMEGLYDLDSSIQRSVDTAMEANPDLGKAEAVEEFLSDYAAVLDTRLILRVWNAIKDALNKLGISFKDDSVRYLLSQARRYARSPQRGFTTDLNEIARDLRSVEYGTAPGRYKPASEGFKDMRTVGELARMGLELPTSLQEGLDAMQGKWGDFDNNWRKFKSTFLSLGTFDSRVNPGSKRLHDILQEASDIGMSVRDRLNTTMRVALNRGIAGTGLFGKSAADYERVNNLLHHARIRAIMALRETPDKSRALLVEYDEATGTYKPTDELERLDNLYRLKFEDARDGFSYTFKNIDEDGNVQGEQTISVPGIDGLTRDSEIWRSYEAARKGYIDTEVQLLIAQLSAGTIREKSALKEIGSVVPDAQLNTEERALMRRAIRRYKELYEAGSSINSEGAIVYVDKSTELANEFAKAFNMAIIANEEAASDAEAKARNDAVKKFFDQPIQDDVVAEIEAFKKRASEGAGFGADRFIVQRAITSLHTQSMQEGGSGEFLRRSVVAQYSPIVREGAYETRTRAVDVRTGKPVALDAGFKDGLVYAQFATMSEANAFRKKAAEAFGDTPYTVRARGPDGQMQEIEVRFEFVTGEVLVEAATPLKVNVNEFVAGLNYFGISIRPEKREEIIQALTRQDSRARNRLLAGLNPGDARDAIAGIAKHIDGRASTIAKTLTRPKVDELMSPRIAESRLLWEGNKPKVDALRANLDALRADPNASDKTIDVAQREYDEALMMYKWTNPEPGVSRRTEALNKAASLLKFLDQNASVNDSDLEASGLVSTWRSYTSLVQLGGSIATGLLNPVSVYTNGVPYLASYNPKTAFGGGFGGRSLIEVNRAFAQVGVPGMKNLQGMNTAEFWREVQSNPALQKKHKVSAREAEMIALQIREGRMIPAQHNALVSTSRGRTTRDAFSKAIDLWMSPFNLTEQASRRAFGLASFRLEYQRQLQGIDPTLDRNSAEYTIAEQAAYDRAVDFTTRALDVALGDYAVMNRPAFFRAGLPGLIYMYKVFPTTSIQMFRNLSLNGKMVMLAALWLLGGVAAFPFAEDLEDLIDTLMQTAGVGEGSVRAWLATNLVEPIAPGMSPVVFRGLLSDYFGGDIAGRVSLSPLPGTDMFVAGADVSRALGEIAGPIPSALIGTVQFAKDLVRAPFSTTVTAEQVLREAPVTALRMVGDAYAYTQAGAIIDRRGYVVSPDVSGAEILVRLLGFYPTRAAEEYGNIRVINRVANYRREAVTSFRQAWVSARVRNDRGRMREIEQAVRDWNNYHRGGPLVIDNFRQGSIRAYREAIRPAVERTLRTTPLSSREYLERATDLMTR